MDYKKLREELDCHRPLYFFHDDPDGLSSFLLFYRFIKEGRGIVVKSHPSVDKKFVTKVEEYSPDKIFVLDLAIVSDEFLELVKTPIVWIDHHMPQEPRGTHYYNPRLDHGNVPASLVCYEAVRQDLWIAATGVVGDWFYHPLLKKFSDEYPDLLPADLKRPEQILFGTPIGRLARVFSFILKGKTEDAMQCIKILTRVEDPHEILDRTTSRGKYIYQRYQKMDKEYQLLLTEAADAVSDDKFLIYVYPGSKMSFARDLSNELSYRFPDKINVIGREKSGEIKCSVTAKEVILPAVQKSLVGIKGYGGGHEHACGVVVEADDFPRFLEKFREHMKNS
jgi:single-stranded DNA-specific DHH superfamily exonuclease